MLTLDANIWIGAFDPADRFHDPSTTFLSSVTTRRLKLYGPTWVLLETACALARRTQSVKAAESALERLRDHPLLNLLPLDDHLLAAAARLGGRQLLRGGDALYAATADIQGARLISWDDELIRRAGAMTPRDWLAANL